MTSAQQKAGAAAEGAAELAQAGAQAGAEGVQAGQTAMGGWRGLLLWHSLLSSTGWRSCRPAAMQLLMTERRARLIILPAGEAYERGKRDAAAATEQAAEAAFSAAGTGACAAAVAASTHPAPAPTALDAPQAVTDLPAPLHPPVPCAAAETASGVTTAAKETLAGPAAPAPAQRATAAPSATTTGAAPAPSARPVAPAAAAPKGGPATYREAAVGTGGQPCSPA